MNTTPMLQLDPAPRLVPHVLLWTKSPLFNPVTEILVMTSDEFPPFESEIPCEADCVPTACVPNVRLDGTRLAVGALGLSVKTAEVETPLSVAVIVTLI